MTDEVCHCPFCGADEMTQKQMRWAEACLCFRTHSGEVTTVEASKYLRRNKEFFLKLVKMGQLKASIETNRNGRGFLYWIKAKDAINAVRTEVQ